MGKRIWYLLLLAPFAGLLVPSFYDRIAPRWIGLPFFYWYQMMWVALTGILLGFVYLMTREREA